MPVIVTNENSSPRGNRGKGFDKKIRRFASTFLDYQRAGHVTCRDLATKLNADGVKTPAGGQWGYSVVYRMLRQGKKLGIPFTIWGRSEALSRCKRTRRAANIIQEERRAQYAALVAALRLSKARLTDTDITSAGDPPLLETIEAEPTGFILKPLNQHGAANA